MGHHRPALHAAALSTAAIAANASCNPEVSRVIASPGALSRLTPSSGNLSRTKHPAFANAFDTACRHRVSSSTSSWRIIIPLRKNRKSSSTQLKMSLIPIPAFQLSSLLVTGLPTSAQYAAYWGRTSRERYQSMAESFNVTFLGVFGAYFLSFILGQFVAMFAGFVAAFWVLLSPELKAYNRNWELRGGRDLVDPWLEEEVDFGDLDEDQRGLYGAYFFGRVVRAAVVEDPNLPPSEEYPLEEFDDYTMETDENERLMGTPWNFRLMVTDQEGRDMQVHGRMSEEYLDIEEGMPVAGIVLSTSQNFEQLAGLTDFCIPDAQCWVGDYPYLDRTGFESSIVKDGLWGTLLEEGAGDFASDKESPYYEADEDIDDDDRMASTGGDYDDDLSMPYDEYDRKQFRR